MWVLNQLVSIFFSRCNLRHSPQSDRAYNCNRVSLLRIGSQPEDRSRSPKRCGFSTYTEDAPRAKPVLITLCSRDQTRTDRRAGPRQYPGQALGARAAEPTEPTVLLRQSHSKAAPLGVGDGRHSPKKAMVNPSSA